eukprot:830269_1
MGSIRGSSSSNSSLLAAVNQQHNVHKRNQKSIVCMMVGWFAFLSALDPRCSWHLDGDVMVGCCCFALFVFHSIIQMITSRERFPNRIRALMLCLWLETRLSSVANVRYVVVLLSLPLGIHLLRMVSSVSVIYLI